MGGVPVKHHTKGKVGRRRSHHALKPTNLLACTECKAPVLAHRVCGNCGTLQTRSTRAAAPQVKHEKKVEKAVAPAEEVSEAPAEEAVEAEAAEEVASEETEEVADAEGSAEPEAEQEGEERT
jgi:large subunit ribosomal protein L32